MWIRVWRGGRLDVSPAELILRGGRVLVGDPADKNFITADLRLRGGRIAEIGHDVERANAEVVDCSANVDPQQLLDLRTAVANGVVGHV